MSKGKVKVRVVTQSGNKPFDREVEIPATHALLADVLKEAGLSAEGMNLTVDNRPADGSTSVKDGSTIALTEKVRGS